MAAVMITLPAATLILTMLAASAAVTLRPAAFAIFCGKLEVSAKSAILPLAVKVSTTVPAEGGGGDGGRDGGGEGGVVSLPPPQAQHKPTLFSRPLFELY